MSKAHKNVAQSLISRKVSTIGNARFNVFYPSSPVVTSNGRTYLSLLKRMLIRALLKIQTLCGIDVSVIIRMFIVEFLNKYGIPCQPVHVSHNEFEIRL